MKNISLEINGVLFDQLTVAENYRDLVDGQENKTRIADREGMVYVFSKDCMQGFVNENQHLEFDIIMVDSRGRITAIHTHEEGGSQGRENG